jgi:hypothetical protein
LSSDKNTFRWRLAAAGACAAALALPTGALAGGGGINTGGGSGGGGGGSQTTSGSKAKLKANGKAIAPASAPRAVKRAIEAANEIDKYRYSYGGGHNFKTGYDCSGAVSYVLGPKGAGLIEHAMTSGDFARWASKGKGNWITTYGDSGHVFVVIAGLRFDTSQPDDGNSGPGWSKDVSEGFVNVSKSAARHKGGL